MPTQDDLVINFKKDIGAFAKKENLKLTFVFGEPQAGGMGKPGFISFTTSETGAFASALSFLKDIEASRYLVALGPVEFFESGKEWKVSAAGKGFSKPEIIPGTETP